MKEANLSGRDMDEEEIWSLRRGMNVSDVWRGWNSAEVSTL